MGPMRRFRHAGLHFGADWAPYDVARWSETQRAAVQRYLGRFVRVHPADETRFERVMQGLDVSAAESEADVETAEAGRTGEPVAEHLAELGDAVGVSEAEAASEPEVPSPAASDAASEPEVPSPAASEAIESADAELTAALASEETDYGEMTVAELRAIADELSIELRSGMKKSEIIVVLEAATT
jgi:hypothetical protein